MRFMCSWLLLLACQEKLVAPDYTQQGVSAEAQALAPLFDPDKLPNILGEKNAYLEAKFAESDSMVPKVDIDLSAGKTNFYEIQRCPAGVALKTAAGDDPLTHSYASETQKRQDYLYVWGKAAAGACTLLEGIHISTPFVDDFGTEQGDNLASFFYLVRPCLFGNNSIYRGRRVCSHAFARTEVIAGYVNPIVSAQHDNRAKLAQRRTRLEHRMAQMASVVREKAYYLSQCEVREAKKNALKRRLAGIAKVYLTATAITTAAILSGGTAAFLAGTATIQLGDKLFAGVSNATLHCPTAAYDKRIRALRDDAEETAQRIGELREALGEIAPAGKEPPPVDEAVQVVGVNEACQAEGLGAHCLADGT